MTSRYFLLPLVLSPLTAGELTLAKKPFRIERNFEATVLPTEPTVFSIDPEKAGEFVIETIADHGSSVKTGDVIVGFKREAYDRQVEDLKRAIAIKELAVGRQRIDVAMLAEETKMQVDAARRAMETAAEDLEYFVKTGRPAAEATIEQGLVISRYRLASAEEELKQLRQMYEEDDLTEETEEIILKRQIVQVDDSKFDLKEAEREAKRSLETELPRRLVQYEQAAAQGKMAFEKADKNLPSALRSAELELDGAEAELARQKLDLERLEKDGGFLEWKSPVDGVLFHGGLEDGSWEYDDLAKHLVVGNAVPLRRTLFSVVPSDSAKRLAAQVETPIARDLAAGEVVSVTLPGSEQQMITAKISSVDPIPSPEGKHGIELEATWPETGAPVTATKLQCLHIDYENPEAIILSTDALKATADGGWTVELKLADGKTEKRSVTRGRASDKEIEITAGLEEGQVVITAD